MQGDKALCDQLTKMLAIGSMKLTLLAIIHFYSSINNYRGIKMYDEKIKIEIK